MPFIELNGERLHYTFSLKQKSPQAEPEAHDDRVPLLLIPGAGETVMHWPPQLRRHREWPVYALDLPGHGESDGEMRDTVEAYAQVVADFVEAVVIQQGALERVALVGHSMGGAIAQVLLTQEPEWVAGLVLSSTGAQLKVSTAILNGLTADFEQITSHIVSWSYGPDSESMKEQALSQMRTVDPMLLLNDFRACDGFNLIDQLPETDLPILILCGKSDFMTPPKLSEHLHETFPNSQLVLVEGAGHMLQLEKAADFTDQIISFWKDR